MSRRADVVAEIPVWLEVNGRRAAAWTCSPGGIEALAAGWLLANGYIERAEELYGLDVVEGPGAAVGVNARVAPAGAGHAEAQRRHRIEHGCGLLHFIRCDPDALPARVPASAPPDPERLAALFRELFLPNPESERGGLHAAALGDGQALRFRSDEVGRHNAVDKAIGAALLAGAALPPLGLVVSSRISGEIALKAARARLAWLASRSIPTSLAVQLASAAGLPIIARAAGAEPVVFR